MGERNGLLTLAVYLAASLLIVLVAMLGIYQYSATTRFPGLTPAEEDPAAELAVSYVDMAPQASAQRARSADITKQRIRLLETMLDDKTQQLRTLSQQLEEKTAQFEDLRARYDEAVMLAVASLSQAPPVAAGAEQAEGGTHAPRAGPAELEAELSAAREIHASLLSDVTVLQDELSHAQQELAQLKEVRDQQTMDRLREAMMLENAAAGVLLSVGRPAVPALREALNHASPDVRRWAATVLGGMASDAEDAIPALTEALSDADPDVRAAARSALESIER